MRLDKFLSNYGIGSRKEVKKFIKKGLVKVNQEVIKTPNLSINPEKDTIYFDGEKVNYKKNYYFMFNKPSGYITAREDNYYPVVMDFFLKKPSYKKLFPVGRLDLDTEGLLIITTDGQFAHRLSHPKWNIEKKYFAVVKGYLSEENLNKYEIEGIYLKEDKYQTKPFKIDILHSHSKESEIFITVHEGKYHIVKKIMEEIGNPVKYLKRVKIGNLELDKNLETGQYRELIDEEIKGLKALVNL